MKRLIKHLPIILIGLGSFGCDPSESLDAIIENGTSTDIKIHFVSTLILSDLLNNTESLTVASGENVNYHRIGSNPGIGHVGLSLIDYESIYITNTSNEVLKVFKKDTLGKNIYNIDEYWTVTEPSKNHFVYTYTITDEDLGN